MVDLVYCEPKTEKTTNIANIERKKVVICECTGNENVTFVDEDKIPSYSGDLKSPVGIIWVNPNEDVPLVIRDSDIRKWVKDACLYHKIPHILLSLVLQNENAANVPEWRKWGQFLERSGQTAVKVFEKNVFEISKYIPLDILKRAAKGSAGLANISNSALEDGVKHSIEKYARPPIPTSIAKTIFGINADTRIPGDDWRNDIYYAAAHLRYLIDRIFGNCFSGELSYEQLRQVVSAYNGSGNKATKYGNDAINNLKNAIEGKGVLYFYEK